MSVYVVQLPERTFLRRRWNWRTDESFGAHLTMESAQQAAELVAPHWHSITRASGATAWNIQGAPLWRVYRMELYT